MSVDARENERKMLVSYFNLMTGKNFGAKSQCNVDIANSLLDVASVGEIRNSIKDWATENKDERGDNCFKKFAETFIAEKDFKFEEAKTNAVNQQVDTGVDFISKVVVELLARTKSEEIQKAVVENAREEVMKFIADTYGPLERKVVLDLGERKVELEGVVHEKFDTVLKFVQANEPVFLTGAAGTGKNFLCQQVAKTLGLDFYFSNAVTQEYKLTGFTDAMGVYHESQFYKAFKNGGLFMLDEMDASIPEVLIILNAALANRYFDFPAPIGYVEAHKDFRVIAAGNTFGNGADYDYVGRNQLDAASLDRFAMVRIDYDKRIEENCAMGNADLLNFCRKFREATKKAGIRTVVSYRAITRMAKLASLMDTEELLEDCLLKSLEIDDLNAIKNDVCDCGEYTKAFNNIVSRKKVF